MRVLVIITYYRRKESCERLVSKLLKDSDADIVVFDDCSEESIRARKRVEVVVNPEHRGKAGFWQTYNDIFAYCKEHEYDYYIFLPDDVYPCDGFVDKCVERFNKIGFCISLSPLLTNQSIVRGMSRWGKKPILVGSDYYVTYFFDCCGVVKREFFEALDWRLKPIEPSTNKYKSSGVGRQITTRLQEKGMFMCHVKRTLLSTTRDESEMNKAERQRNPMRADFNDNESCVDMYMASLWRGGHVMVTAKSLLRQPELKTLTICCNNYTDEQFEKVERELADERVRLIRTNNEKGSNEKMRMMWDGDAKYIALADDDLVYPDGYLFKMIHGCNIYDGAVSLHGSMLKRFPVKKYYGGRIMFKWKRDVDEDVQVDILGNGFILFKREWFTEQELRALYDDAPTVSMDDIVLSCELKRKKIPTWVLKHGKRYASHKKESPSDVYVYDQYKNNDGVQVNYLNAKLKRDMLVPKPIA